MTRKGINRLVILAVAVVVVGGGLTTAVVVKQGITRKQLESAREQGLMLHRAGEHEAAIPHLSRYVARHKDDAEALLAFGLSRKEVSLPNEAHVRQAIAMLKAASDLDPSSLEIQQALLDLYIHAGFLTELVEQADRVLSIDAAHRRALSSRIQALVGLGRAGEAVETAERLVDAHGDLLDSHANYATALGATGASPEVIAGYVRSIGPRFSTSVSYHDWLSRLEWSIGERNDAIRHARTAASLTPESAEEVARLVDWLRLLDRATTTETGRAETGALGELAEGIFARALEDDRLGPQLAVEATKRAWWDGRADLARQFASRLRVPALEDDADATGWSALVALTMAEPDDRPDSVRREQRRDWESVLSAMKSVMEQSPENAITTLDGADPTDPETHALMSYVRGIAMRQIGDQRGSMLAFRDAAEAGGIVRDRAWKALGDILAAMGQLEESEAAYRNLQQRESIPALQRVDRILSRVEQTRESDLAQTMLSALRDAAVAEPDDLSVRVRLARAMLLAGLPVEGLKEARALLDMEGVPDPVGVLGLCRTLQSVDSGLAMELLAALSRRDDNVDLLYSRAAMLARDGKLDEARDLLAREVRQRSGAEALPYHRALVRLLDQYDRRSAIEAMRVLSADHEHSASAQLSVLQSISAWNEIELARAAIARLRNAVGENNLSWRVYEARADLAENPSGEKLSQVVLSLSAVLRQNPDDFDALILTARAYQAIAERQRADNGVMPTGEYIDLASGFYDRAAGEGARAFAFRPYIEMLLDHDRAAQANSVLDRFIAVRSIPPVCRAQRVELLTRVRRWSDAIDDQAWFAATGVPDTVLNLAELYARSGDRAAATRITEQFLDGEPPRPADRLRAAQIFLLTGQPDRSSITLAGLEPESELGQRDRVIGNFYMENRRPDLALPHLLVVARSSTSVADWVRAIQAAVGAEQAETAERLLAEARSAHPGSPELAAFDDERPTRRYSQLVASSIAPGSPADELELADIATRHSTGRISDQELIDTLDAFSSQHPANYAAWRLRSAVLLELGQTAPAIEVTRAARAALPQDPRPLRELIRLLHSTGRTDDAINLARDLAALLRPETYEPDSLIASMELTRGNYTEAVNRLVTHRARFRSESVDRPSPAFATYVIALAGADRPDEAYTLLRDRLTNEDTEWTRLLLQAIDALPTDRLEIKREWLDRVTAESLALARSELWLQIGRFSGERNDLLQVAELADQYGNSSSPSWQWVVAESGSMLERWRQAEENYRSLIDEFPDLVPASIGLADLLARQPERAEEAVRFVDEALIAFTAPDRMADPWSIGWLETARAEALSRLGRPAEAREAYERTLERTPGHTAALIGLSSILIEEGDTARARQLLRQVALPAKLDARHRQLLAGLRAKLD